MNQHSVSEYPVTHQVHPNHVSYALMQRYSQPSSAAVSSHVDSFRSFCCEPPTILYDQMLGYARNASIYHQHSLLQHRTRPSGGAPPAYPLTLHSATFPANGPINNDIMRNPAGKICLETIAPDSKYKQTRSFQRYDSDDSGYAESPRSVLSTINWASGDESPIEFDTLERQFGSERKPNNSRKGSISENVKDANDNISNEKENNRETFWNIGDDNKYWIRLRQKPPSNSAINAIVKQVEYYLSDEHLAKDKYLLRQIRCKKDGYISIKLMTSFKKVKKLTRDWAVLRSAVVRKSTTLVVSSEGLRLKRRVNLSETLRKPRLLTTILVIRLPEKYNFVDRITSLFGTFGEIGYVRLLRPDKEVPTDLRNYATQVPDLGKSLCAIIDFEAADDALTAVRVLKHFQRQIPRSEITDDIFQSSEDLQNILIKHPPLCDLRLALLGPRVRRTLYRQDKSNSTSLERKDEPKTHWKPPWKQGFLPAENRTSGFASKNYDFQRTSSDLPESEIINSANLFTIASHPETRTHISTNARTISTLTKELRDNLVLRQPKGPENHKGFTLKRSETAKIFG